MGFFEVFFPLPATCATLLRNASIKLITCRWGCWGAAMIARPSILASIKPVNRSL